MRRFSRNNVCLYNNVKTNTNLTNILPKLTILEEWEMRIMLVLQGEYIQGMKELNFYFAQCNMPKMEKNQELALSASYLEIYQMYQLKVVALGR